MKILFVHLNSDLYGASRALLRLSACLLEKGHEVDIILGSDGPLTERLDALGITPIIFTDLAALERANLSTPKRMIQLAVNCRRTQRFLTEKIRTLKPDILHSNTSILLANGKAARRTRIPHVWHLRETYEEFPLVWKFYRRIMLRGASRILCVSDSVAAQFRPEEAKRKITRVHDGLSETEVEPPTADACQKIRKTHGVPADTLTVGVPGRIKCVRKGQEVFVEAAILLAEKYPHVLFLIVGTTYPGNESHETTLRNRVQEAGLEEQIRFTGELSSSREIMALLDIVVVPSGVAEPFGYVTSEAMAAARPVVGTNIGGTREIVADQQTGLLFDPGNTSQLVTHLETLMNDPALRKSMGAAGRKRFEKHFTMEQTCEQILSCYTSLPS